MTTFAALPGPLRGALWMVAEAASITAMIASVRYVSTTIPAHEIAFFRGVFGLLIQLPWLLRAGGSAFRPAEPKLVALRSALACAGMLFWFVALATMPISDAVALAFTAPLFAILGAGLILRETVGTRRWIFAGLGFCGALIIIRPGFTNVNPMVVFVLMAALSNASVQVTTKRLAMVASGNMLTFHMNLMLAPVALVFALPGWVTPAWSDVPWLVAVGLFGTLAHIFLTRAMALADASLMSPVDFMRLPFAALYGWLLFGEASDLWTWVGAAVIFACITYITRFEAQAAARRGKEAAARRGKEAAARRGEGGAAP